MIDTQFERKSESVTKKMTIQEWIYCFDNRASFFPTLGSRLGNAICRLRETHKYADDITTENLLKIKGVGKSTIQRFEKLKKEGVIP